MRVLLIAAWMAGAGALSAGAFGQSLNIRFGAAATAPSSAYAAAGLPGVWNSFQTSQDYSIHPLVGLDGSPVGATFYQAGNSTILSFNNPLTSGDDEKLMDSMYLSTNSPTDGCFWVQGLEHGQYEVTIYAMTPNDATLITRTRVDNGTPGPVMIGGAWPGHQQEGVTYSRFTIMVTDGTIAFHDGLAGAYYQSGMNGAQFRFMGSCAAPELSTQPVSATACPTGSAPFSVAAAGTGLSYQWQIETSAGVWQGMGNDPGPLPCGGGAFSYAGPINSPNVTIGVRPCPGNAGTPQHFQIRCVVSNSCGSTNSDEATYTICPADYNCSGAITVQDIFDYLASWFAGASNADFNRAGGVTVQDIFDFLGAWFTGC